MKDCCDRMSRHLKAVAHIKQTNWFFQWHPPSLMESVSQHQKGNRFSDTNKYIVWHFLLSFVYSTTVFFVGIFEARAARVNNDFV